MEVNTSNNDPKILISLQGQDGVLTDFMINPNVRLSKLMDAYCRKKNVGIRNVVFLYGGKRLARRNTPAELGMEKGDVIEVMQHVHGGTCDGFEKLA